MIYPGTDLKFRLTTEIPDFHLSEDAFSIVVKDKYFRTVAAITKNDCFYDDQGNWYFTLSKVRSGWYYAYFTAQREDEDFDDQLAQYKDSQLLCVVGYCKRHAPLIPDCCRCHNKVHYEQVWSVSIDGADYLADCDGNYIYTSDGKRIQFINQTSQAIEDMGKVMMNMTGEEFLKMWQERDPNSEVNTIPEMMDVMRGISDEETIPGKIQQEIDENEQENEASDEDIDSIFDEEPDGGGAGMDTGADDGEDDV